jgi:hypothetical protein
MARHTRRLKGRALAGVAPWQVRFERLEEQLEKLVRLFAISVGGSARLQVLVSACVSVRA